MFSYFVTRIQLNHFVSFEYLRIKIRHGLNFEHFKNVDNSENLENWVFWTFWQLTCSFSFRSIYEWSWTQFFWVLLIWIKGWKQMNKMKVALHFVHSNYFSPQKSLYVYKLDHRHRWCATLIQVKCTSSPELIYFIHFAMRYPVIWKRNLPLCFDIYSVTSKPSGIFFQILLDSV